MSEVKKISPVETSLECCGTTITCRHSAGPLVAGTVEHVLSEMRYLIEVEEVVFAVANKDAEKMTQQPTGAV